MVVASSLVEREVASPDKIVLVADAQMGYLAVSDAACRLLGYSREELLGMRVPEVVAEPDAHERYQQMVQDGHHDGQITLVCKDGRRVPAQYEAQEAQAEGLTYYVSVLTPLPPVGAEAARSSRLRVLVADDDQSTRFLITTLLSFVEEVELIGEAADGAEAVQLVIEHDPDLVLLDVQMPRMDGLAAAELIKALRPHIHVVLHSAEADQLLRHRAAKSGLQLLDKMQTDEVIDALTTPPPLAEGVKDRPDPRIETAVVTALTARSTTPVVIIAADRSVPFYNTLAANLLGLPLPARPTELDAVSHRYQVLDPDSRTPIEPAARPIERSIAERRTIVATLILSRSGTSSLCRFTSLPFFDGSGGFLGAALYIEPIAELN